MDNKEKKIEKLRLEDGRWAERHTFLNEEGQEVSELYVEPEKELRLDQRVVLKKKEYVTEERVETIKDGEVVDVRVNSVEPNVRMELREHIRRVDDEPQKGTYVPKNTYVTQDQLDALVSSLRGPVVSKEISAQSVVEDRVANSGQTNYAMMLLLGLVAALMAYLVWWN